MMRHAAKRRGYFILSHSLVDISPFLPAILLPPSYILDNSSSEGETVMSYSHRSLQVRPFLIFVGKVVMI